MGGVDIVGMTERGGEGDQGLRGVKVGRVAQTPTTDRWKAAGWPGVIQNSFICGPSPMRGPGDGEGCGGQIMW